jgi:hypothetical protein
LQLLNSTLDANENCCEEIPHEQRDVLIYNQAFSYIQKSASNGLEASLSKCSRKVLGQPLFDL